MDIITRNEAKALGLKTYFTGEPCIHGHLSERYTINKRCVICARMTYSDNPEKRKEISNRYNRNRTPEQRAKGRESHQRWKEKNPDKLHEQWRNQSKRLMKKIRTNLRQRLNQAIKRGSRGGSAVRDLGCSITEFKSYIEGKFYDNMAWDNWGHVWQLDHIQPLKNYDLSDHEQIKEVCYYSNLQPLLIEDHTRKTLLEISQHVFVNSPIQ